MRRQTSENYVSTQKRSRQLPRLPNSYKENSRFRYVQKARLLGACGSQKACRPILNCAPCRDYRWEDVMAKGEQRGNREKKKPKKEKVKTIAAAPSQKGAAAGWQPSLGSGKKK